MQNHCSVAATRQMRALALQFTACASSGKTTKTASVGGQVSAQTPSVGGNSVGVDATIKANIKID